MAKIDELSIELTADISKAETAINKLSTRLSGLEKQLVGLNAKNLTAIGQAVSNLGSGMNKLKGVGEKRFETLANSINKLATVDAKGISKTASALTQMTNAFNTAGSVGSKATDIASIADAIRKFGYSTVPQAIANMPKLATALNQMMRTLSTAPQVSQNLIQMTNALANLASASKGVQYQSAPSINKGFTSIKKSAKKLINVLKKLGSQLKKNESSFKGFASYIGKFYATYFMVIRAIKGIGSSITKGMDYIETFNYFNVALNKVKESYAKSGEENAEALADGFTSRLKELNNKMTGYNVGENGELFGTDTVGLGLDPNQLMNYQARILAVTNSVGLLGKTSVDTAEGLSMLASDLSSLTNTDIEDVMSNLQSGLIGQSRALYRYGIDITNATLGEYALRNNITKSVSAMSQSEKMQLRMLAILDQSKVAWTDQATTINSVANQYRIFSQQISNFGRILGNLFLPIVKTVLPYVNGLVIALQNLLTTLGFTIFGDTWLSDLLKDTSTGYGDGLEDVAENLEESAESAKQLKSYLMGIDELNVIGDTSGSGSSSAGGIDLSGAISNALEEYQDAWDKAIKNSENLADKYAKVFEKAFKPIYAVIDELKNGAFKTAGQTIANSIKDSLNAINWETIFSGASSFGSKFARFLNGLFDPTMFESVGKTIANAIKTSVISALSFAKTLEWSSIGSSIAGIINGVTQNYPWKEQIELGGTVGTGIADALNKVFDDLDVDSLSDYLWGKLDAILEGAFNFVTKFEWKDAQEKISDLFRKIIEKMNEKQFVLGYGFLSGWERLGIVAGELASGLISMFESVPWLKVFDGAWETVKEAWEKFASTHPFIAALAFDLALFATTLKSMNILGTIASAIGGGASVKSIAGASALGINSIVIPIALSIGIVGTSKALYEGIDDKYKTNKLGGMSWEQIKHETIDLLNPDVDTSDALIWKPAEWVKKNFNITDEEIEEALRPLNDVYLGALEIMYDIGNLMKYGVPSETHTSSSGITHGGGGGDGYVFKGFQDELKDTTDIVNQETGKQSISINEYVNKISSKISSFGKDYNKTIDGVKTSTKTAETNVSASFDGMNTSFSESTSSIAETAEKVFSKDKWTFSGVFEGLSLTFSRARDTVNSLWNEIVDIIGASEVTTHVSSSGRTHGGSGRTFATGGFPEDGIFFANHNELVGGFSNGRTAVANNSQIVEGIEGGVERAVSTVLAPYLQQIVTNTRETANKDLTVNIGDRDIAKANRRGEKALGLKLITQG